MNESEKRNDLIERVHNTSKGNIHYWITDDKKENSAFLIFLPGLTADYRLFDKQVEQLKEKHNVFVWDAPGHADSYPFDLTYSLEDKARWLNEIVIKEERKTRSRRLLHQIQ